MATNYLTPLYVVLRREPCCSRPAFRYGGQSRLPYMKTSPLLRYILMLMLLAGAVPASTSLQGSFTQDDDVQYVVFVLLSSGDVTLRTWSYAGGVDVDGVLIPP